jgi:hypothetical protein
MKDLCLGPDQRACPFHRFQRAAGRPLRIEDHRAWERRRAEEATRKRAATEGATPGGVLRLRGEGPPGILLEGLPLPVRGGLR